MALYQSTDILKESQMKGSFKVEYAPYVVDHTTAVWVDVGMCDNPNIVENIEFLDGQASNASKPEILTGVGKQMLAIGFDPWAYDPTNFFALRGGIDTIVNDALTGIDSVYTGGNSKITSFMIRFTNRRDDYATAGDVAKYIAEDLTIGDKIYRDFSVIAFKCNPTAGVNITGKVDSDTDPALRFPMTFEGIEDTTRDAGKQLSVTVRTVTKVA